MIGIVPLAGPDFERADGSVKAEFPVDGLPLLRRALESRPWWQSGALTARDLIFVLRDTGRSRRFAQESLEPWYPGCRQVFLSDTTAGAALSSAAAIGLVRSYEEPLAIDLCDILFDGPLAPLEILQGVVGGVAITFASGNPKYSYLACDDRGAMIRAREKTVISDRASAGVYFFASAPVFLAALAHSMRNRQALAWNGLLYVCPMLNGVAAQGLEVRTLTAANIRDIHIGPQP